MFKNCSHHFNCKTVSMPKVGLLIFPFWILHFFHLDSSFWLDSTLKLYSSVLTTTNHTFQHCVHRVHKKYPLRALHYHCLRNSDINKILAASLWHKLATCHWNLWKFTRIVTSSFYLNFIALRLNTTVLIIICNLTLIWSALNFLSLLTKQTVFASDVYW